MTARAFKNSIVTSTLLAITLIVLTRILLP